MNLKNERERITRREREIRDELSDLSKNLTRLESDCGHTGYWSDPVYDPIRTEAYTIPGDKPGTMGVDRRGPCHVPASTKDRWRRTCSKCGKIETTTRSKEKIKKTRNPVF